MTHQKIFLQRSGAVLPKASKNVRRWGDEPTVGRGFGVSSNNSCLVVIYLFIEI